MLLCRQLLLALILSVAVRAQSTDLGIAFSGVLISEGKPKLALTDKASGTTRWVEPGDNFNGYTIDRYNAEEESLIVKKDGQEHRLSLVAARSIEPATNTTADAAPDEASLDTIRGNLRQLAAAARQFQIDRGATTASFADLVGPDKYIKELRSVAGENYTGITITPATTALSVTTANGANVSLDLQPAAVAAAPQPTPSPAPPPSPDQPPASDPAASTPSPAPAAPPTAAPLAPTGNTYIIQQGDTLGQIATTSGLTIQQLRALNPGLNPAALQPGQSIRIR